MSKNHEGHVRGYTLTSETYYPWIREKHIVDEVVFGFYAPEGGTSGEMSIYWERIEYDQKPVPCLHCYSDAWHALAQFSDVIVALGSLVALLDDNYISPKQFCKLLDGYGFIDRTERIDKRA